MQTRIICTLGPASTTHEVLAAMADAGMSHARLNFSHGTAAEHRERADRIRQIAADSGRAIELIQDLQGPKIRTVDTPRTTLRRGEEVWLSATPRPGAIQISEPLVLNTVEPGHHIYIDDGLIDLQAIRRDPDGVLLRVLIGGTFEGNQGAVFPSSVLPLPALTEKDIADLEVGRSIGVEWVALSFVQHGQDILDVRARLGVGTRVIAKIETPAALADLTAIVAASDAVMVARGDLGVSIQRARVPLVQKDIITLARGRGIPGIVATEMMRSMVDHPYPTRAEVSDVATAVLDGAAAVMLSEETAIGAYPAPAVAEMRQVIEVVEESSYYHWASSPPSTPEHMSQP
jgi:pyruvate kinase